MTKTVKEFIEGHKKLIEENKFEELLEESYDGFLDLRNSEVEELVDVLEAALGIDLTDVRNDLLYDKVSTMLEHIIALKPTQKNRSLHKSMFDYMKHWYGYSINYVIDFVKKNSYNLGISLTHVGRSPYSGDHYQIEFL